MWKGSLQDKGMVGALALIGSVWDVLNEPWNALGDWIKTGLWVSEISPPGQLHNFNEFSPSSCGRYKYLPGGLPDQFRVKTRAVHDNQVTTISALHFQFRNNIHDLTIYIYSDRIRILREVGGYHTYYVDSIEGQWYIWEFAMDSSLGQVTVYRDSVELYSLSGIKEGGTPGLVWTEVTAYLGEMHEDYLRIVPGLYPPLPLTKTKITDKGLQGVLTEPQALKGVLSESS